MAKQKAIRGLIHQPMMSATRIQVWIGGPFESFLNIGDPDKVFVSMDKADISRLEAMIAKAREEMKNG